MKNLILCLAISVFGMSCVSGAWKYPDKYLDNGGDMELANVQTMMRKTVKLRYKITLKVTEGGMMGSVIGRAEGAPPPATMFMKTESSGSGVIVESDSDKDESLILTAWHVCDTIPLGTKFQNLFYDIEVVDMDSEILTYDSRVLSYREMAKIKEYDTCVVATKGVAGEPAELARRDPRHGSKIFATGAPAGKWGRFNVYVEDGRFLGIASDDIHVMLGSQDTGPTSLSNFAYFTVPGSPGISGGPVWYDGKIIALWNITAAQYGHSGFGPSLKMLKETVSKAKAKWE